MNPSGGYLPKGGLPVWGDSDSCRSRMVPTSQYIENLGGESPFSASGHVTEIIIIIMEIVAHQWGDCEGSQCVVSAVATGGRRPSSRYDASVSSHSCYVSQYPWLHCCCQLLVCLEMDVLTHLSVYHLGTITCPLSFFHVFRFSAYPALVLGAFFGPTVCSFLFGC